MSDLIQPLTFALIGLSYALGTTAAKRRTNGRRPSPWFWIGCAFAWPVIAAAHVAYVLHVISRGAYSLGDGKP